ncbi:MAG: gluconokinase [Bacillota bacterium]
MKILALEVSTSSAKAIIYSTREGIIKTNSVSFAEKVSSVASQETDIINQSMKNCVKEILKKEKDNIDIITLASTWHSFLLVDKKRRPLTNILSWANNEAAGITGKYRKNRSKNSWFYNKTGCPVHSIYPLWKWKYIQNKKNFSSKKVYLSSKPEYIFEKLTGEIGVSKAVASGTGLFNIHDLEWDEDILEFAGIKKGQLAPLRPHNYQGSLSMEAASELGLKAGTPVIITGPDGALNQIGSGALNKGIMTLSVGTSGALRLANSSPVLPENPSTWCYYGAEGKRIAGAATSGAGNCLNWFKNQVQFNEVELSQLDLLAEKINPEKAPIFLPFLYGERCPGWQDQRNGGFYGLQGETGVGDLYYSVLEGVLFNLYQCYKILIQVEDKPDEIIISGGILNSDYWLQLAADIFQNEITVSTVKNASTMGAIIIALKNLGEIDQLGKYKPKRGEVVEPDPVSKNLYRERFAKYKEYYLNN